MTKLPLNKPLPVETQARFMKLKGGPEEAENQEGNRGTHPRSQAEKATFSPKELASQEKKDRPKADDFFYETKAWLESTFPKAFNFKGQNPLKLGDQCDLLLPPSLSCKKGLRNSLGVYANSKAYLKAIIQENWRDDLNGENVDEVMQEHKNHALKIPGRKKALSKKNKKNKTF